MSWFHKAPKRDGVLAAMDGREVKYVTRRKADHSEEILGKTGRIVCLDGEIRILCGERDVFRCRAEKAAYYLLLSGDGVNVSGPNDVTGQQDEVTVYYQYYRK